MAGLAGTATAAWLAQRARRYSVADRLRPVAPRRSGRAPLWLRARVVVALEDAALDVTFERALSTWTWSVGVAAVVGVGFGGRQIAAGLASLVGLGAPLAVISMRERGSRRIAAVVPEMLER